MLRKELKEAIAGSYHPGTGKGTWTTWGNYNYNPVFGNQSSIAYDQPVVDKEIEAQLIDQAIDILFSRHPEFVQDKKIKRHHLQMLIGKITSGDVNDLITLKSFIKKLKKKGITVEGETMKRSELKELIRETIDMLMNEWDRDDTAAQKAMEAEREKDRKAGKKPKKYDYSELKKSHAEMDARRNARLKKMKGEGSVDEAGKVYDWEKINYKAGDIVKLRKGKGRKKLTSRTSAADMNAKISDRFKVLKITGKPGGDHLAIVSVAGRDDKIGPSGTPGTRTWDVNKEMSNRSNIKYESPASWFEKA